jgi:hypothetical protein
MPGSYHLPFERASFEEMRRNAKKWEEDLKPQGARHMLPVAKISKTSKTYSGGMTL